MHITEMKRPRFTVIALTDNAFHSPQHVCHLSQKCTHLGDDVSFQCK